MSKLRLQGFWNHFVRRTCLILLVTSPAAQATDYAACKDGMAFNNPQFETRLPDKDWICQLTPAPNNPRCVEAQKMLCVGGTRGPRDVPTGGWAWFMAFVEGIEAPHRCTCGCFQKDTEIQTPGGSLPVSWLLEYARYQPVRVLVPDTQMTWKASTGMKATRFTQGPEKKAVYEFHVKEHAPLIVTEGHPMRVFRTQQSVMVRADEVTLDDAFIDADGHSLPIEDIRRIHLPKDEPVINFEIPTSRPEHHMVLAGGIQVGDHFWQRELDAKKLRLQRRGIHLGKNGERI